jgi:hypothetical protein
MSNRKVITRNHDHQGRKRLRCYHQLGAPTLVYEGNRTEERLFRVPSTTLPVDNAKSLCESWKRHNRVKARWQFSLDVDQAESVLMQDMMGNLTGSIRDFGHWDTNHCCGPADKKLRAQVEDPTIDDGQQRSRLAMLIEADSVAVQYKRVLRNHSSHEYPYTRCNVNSENSKKRCINEPSIERQIHSCTEDFGIQYHLNSEASFLAPFDLEGTLEALIDDAGATYRKRLRHGHPKKLPQGNVVLAVLCPCVPCSNRQTNEQSWLLCHPKGPCLERFCVSNLIPPLGLSDVRHRSKALFPQESVKRRFHWSAFERFPNEVDLDDTILEIRQCGTWNAQTPECIFVVRTGTHVSVVNVRSVKPEHRHGSDPSPSAPFSAACWGCYVVTERERIDLRSLSRSLPSFRPVSISCHPLYGNAFTPARFAFVAHSTTNDIGPWNTIHSCTAGVQKVLTERHDITNLRHVSYIDFTSSNPMCLWSAATCFVRPALAPGVVAKIRKMEKGPFGLGSSLYTIDLRTNFAIFQWSPSAEEMVSEGLHGISGISTDWERENSVWVTSTSAGKTWEIDGRMPCRSVNSWSLTSPCEAPDVLTVPSSGFFGDGSLLTKTISSHSDVGSNFGSTSDCSPMVKVDTDVGSSGIHLFQRPFSLPRFQADCLECIATPGIDFTRDSCIAGSSYFALTDVSEDVSICGLASIRFPLSLFVEKDEDIWSKLMQVGDQVAVICALTMTNCGDIYAHSLLEFTGDSITDHSRLDGLPIGARPIPIPEKLDGRTIHVDEGHWKPTGGMNIKLFLSNLYPKSRIAKVSFQPLSWAKVIARMNAQKKVKADKSSAVAQIKRNNHKSSLTINSNGSHKMVHAGSQLTWPLMVSNQVSTKMIFCEDDDQDSRENETTEKQEHKSSIRRSDLSSSGIRGILDNWDVMLSSDSDEDGRLC